MQAEWHYQEAGVQRGPVTSSEIHALKRQGVLTNKTKVWRGGMKNWIALGKIPELRSQTIRGATPGKYRIQASGPDIWDRLISKLVTVGIFAAVAAVAFFGWKYFDFLFDARGPSKQYMMQRYLPKHEEFNGMPPEGQWIEVTAPGGSYEMIFHQLDFDAVESYESKGNMGIPKGTKVFVWDIHMEIERRNTGSGIYETPPKQSRHVRVHIWYKEKNDTGRMDWEPYGIREMPIPINS